MESLAVGVPFQVHSLELDSFWKVYNRPLFLFKSNLMPIVLFFWGYTLIAHLEIVYTYLITRLNDLIKCYYDAFNENRTG